MPTTPINQKRRRTTDRWPAGGRTTGTFNVSGSDPAHTPANDARQSDTYHNGKTQDITSKGIEQSGYSNKPIPKRRGLRQIAPSSNRKIALFVGSDVTAHIITNKLIASLIQKRFDPVVFYPQETITKKAAREGAYDRTAALYRLYERQLTKRIVFPFLDEKTKREGGPVLKPNGEPHENINYSPDDMERIHGIRVEQRVPNINDPEFIKQFADDDSYIGLINIRGYQIAHNELIETFKSKEYKGQKGFAWNIHPAPLPPKRGFLHPPHFAHERSADEEYSWTLHELVYDPKLPHNGIDAGNILDSHALAIDTTDSSPIAFYTAFADEAAYMLKEQVRRFDDGIRITGQPQPQEVNPEIWRYYNYQTLRDLTQELSDAEIVKLQPNKEYMLQFLADAFTLPGSPANHRLYVALEDAVDQWHELNPGATDCKHSVSKYTRNNILESSKPESDPASRPNITGLDDRHQPECA